MTNRRILSSGEGVWDDVIFPRDVLDLKSVHHRSQFDIHEPWVGEICQVLLVAQYGKQGLMVNAKNKVFNAQNEELAFF